MSVLKEELIHLIQNDAEIVYELTKALDLDMLEDDIDTLRNKVKNLKKNGSLSQT